MAKKSRRVRRKGARPRLSKAQLVQPKTQQPPRVTEAPAEVRVAPAGVESAPQPVDLDFRDEYHYVVSDLQRIGVLAALILGALVALSFVL
jgi:hypothetical protein